MPPILAPAIFALLLLGWSTSVRCEEPAALTTQEAAAIIVAAGMADSRCGYPFVQGENELLAGDFKPGAKSYDAIQALKQLNMIDVTDMISVKDKVAFKIKIPTSASKNDLYDLQPDIPAEKAMWCLKATDEKTYKIDIVKIENTKSETKKWDAAVVYAIFHGPQYRDTFKKYLELTHQDPIGDRRARILLRYNPVKGSWRIDYNPLRTPVLLPFDFAPVDGEFVTENVPALLRED
jgi:hypothetical protein